MQGVCVCEGGGAPPQLALLVRNGGVSIRKQSRQAVQPLVQIRLPQLRLCHHIREWGASGLAQLLFQPGNLHLKKTEDLYHFGHTTVITWSPPNTFITEQWQCVCVFRNPTVDASPH